MYFVFDIYYIHFNLYRIIRHPNSQIYNKNKSILNIISDNNKYIHILIQVVRQLFLKKLQLLF